MILTTSRLDSTIRIHTVDNDTNDKQWLESIVDWWNIIFIAIASIAVGIALGISIGAMVMRRKKRRLVQDWKEGMLMKRSSKQ